MRAIVWIIIWVLAFSGSALLDEPVARWMRASGSEAWIERHRDIREFLKLPGEFGAVVVSAVVVWAVHRWHGRAAVFVLACSAASGVNGVIKWMAGRHRPYTWLNESVAELRAFDFMPLRGGLEGLWHPRNLSMPSGHVALAFALAAALAMLFPRARWLFLGVAAVTGLERVWENAHWCSDVVAGAGVGLGVASVIGWVMGISLSEAERTGRTSAARVGSRAVIVDEPPGSPRPYLSLVIPAFNEAENIPTLLSRVSASLSRLGKPFEVLVVDDGSTDATPALLAEAMKSAPWLRVLRMQANSGQSAAFEAGFEAARGDLIATIDADLQNDPEEIPRLAALLEERNVDMVTGWRKERQDTAFRRWQSRQANRIRNWISQETVNDSASSLKVYRAHAVKGLRLFHGAHRFLPTLVKLRGYTCLETPVKHSPRFAGAAKYGFRNRALRAFVDLLAVRWMKSRNLNYRATEMRKEQPRG